MQTVLKHDGPPVSNDAFIEVLEVPAEGDRKRYQIYLPSVATLTELDIAFPTIPRSTLYYVGNLPVMPRLETLKLKPMLIQEETIFQLAPNLKRIEGHLRVMKPHFIVPPNGLTNTLKLEVRCDGCYLDLRNSHTTLIRKSTSLTPSYVHCGQFRGNFRCKVAQIDEYISGQIWCKVYIGPLPPHYHITAGETYATLEAFEDAKKMSIWDYIELEPPAPTGKNPYRSS